MKGARTPAAVAMAALLTGCAATQTVITHGKLESGVRMSQSIFLEPVSSAAKTVFVSVKNTSGVNFDLHPRLKSALQDKGYRVVANPSAAHYLLQANILKAGKLSKSASSEALGGGYGSALAGAGTGVALGALSNNTSTALAGGIAGGLVGFAADTLVQNVSYTVVTDVQISERSAHVVKEQYRASLKNGSASALTQTSSRTSDFQRYQTRVVASADQVNLSFEKARPRLEAELASALAGIF